MSSCLSCGYVQDPEADDYKSLSWLYCNCTFCSICIETMKSKQCNKCMVAVCSKHTSQLPLKRCKNK